MNTTLLRSFATLATALILFLLAAATGCSTSTFPGFQGQFKTTQGIDVTDTPRIDLSGSSDETLPDGRRMIILHIQKYAPGADVLLLTFHSADAAINCRPNTCAQAWLIDSRNLPYSDQFLPRTIHEYCLQVAAAPAQSTLPAATPLTGVVTVPTPRQDLATTLATGLQVDLRSPCGALLKGKFTACAPNHPSSTLPLTRLLTDPHRVLYLATND